MNHPYPSKLTDQERRELPETKVISLIYSNDNERADPLVILHKSRILFHLPKIVLRGDPQKEDITPLIMQRIITVLGIMLGAPPRWESGTGTGETEHPFINEIFHANKSYPKDLEEFTEKHQNGVHWLVIDTREIPNPPYDLYLLADIGDMVLTAIDHENSFPPMAPSDSHQTHQIETTHFFYEGKEAASGKSIFGIVHAGQPSPNETNSGPSEEDIEKALAKAHKVAAPPHAQEMEILTQVHVPRDSERPEVLPPQTLTVFHS